MPRKARDLVARNIGRMVTEEALKSRSKLYQWLHANYAELLPVMTIPRPSWEALAKAAGNAGQKNAQGSDYSRQIVWKTWKQLHQDMQAATQHPAARVRKPSVKTAPPVERPLPAPSNTEENKPHARPQPAGGTFTFQAPTKDRDRDSLIGRRDKTDE